MSSSATDRTINKIAFCGAIFAGVAYVGYSVVKQAFGKTFSKGEKRKEGKNFQPFLGQTLIAWVTFMLIDFQVSKKVQLVPRNDVAWG